MDEFNFGSPARRGPQLRLDPRIVMAAAGLLVVALVGVGFLRFVSRSGHEVASDQTTVVKQIDHAKDAVAESSLRNALAAASVAFTDTQSFSGAGPAELSLLEPSLTWVDGPSTGSTVVSVANTDTAWAAAALSDSGTCFWIKRDLGAGLSGTAYGSGATCTGRAALAGASAPSW